MQAGIGQSYLKDGAGDTTTEIGYIASSRVFYAINESIFLTDDADIPKTDSSLRVNNDLGVNFQVTDIMSTRVSFLTENNDSRAIRSDNTLDLSLVLGF
jgi:putative salt-induced outer membrane protein